MTCQAMTKRHVLMLATTSWFTHPCAFLLLFSAFFPFLFSFRYFSQAELVWWTVGRSSTEGRESPVWPQPDPSARGSSLIPRLTFVLFYCKDSFFFVVAVVFLFFLFTAKSLPHICSTAKLLTSSQPRLPPPPPSQCVLWSNLLFLWWRWIVII